MKNGSKKPPKFSHTSRSPKGMGDYYGTGIKAKIGKMRSDSMEVNELTPAQLKKPPKSLA